MNILVVDNNSAELERTLSCLQTIYPDALLISFDDAMEAVRYGFNHAVDAVYTEVAMRHITGFDVARLIRKKQPEIKVSFLSDTEKHLKLSVQNGGDGYFLKPLDTKVLLCGNLITASAKRNKNYFKKGETQV